MATATKPPGMLAGRLRQQQNRIDEMRASARMRARLMRKTPKPAELPRNSVDVTNASPPGQNFVLAGATVAAMSIGTDANVPNEPLSPPADDQNRGHD